MFHRKSTETENSAIISKETHSYKTLTVAKKRNYVHDLKKGRQVKGWHLTGVPNSKEEMTDRI